MRDDGSTDETLAAPSSPGPKLAHGTTRGSDPTLSAEVIARDVPPGQLTRASQAGTTESPAEPGLPVVDPSHYQILKELARGGMGRILEARDLRLGRPIAIKEVLHADEGARARFDREVQITARLQHPAIVHVTEAGQWPSGQPFFAMKLIQGKPLDSQLAKTSSLAERLALLPAVIAATDALAYAHSRRVIHRDLKPANVLVGDYGETVVIDWGIAKDLAATEVVSLSPERGDRSGGAETVVGSVMGTPSYMPPEQASGDRVDERADVYALGAMLYQVLAGVPPYLGRTTADVLAKVLEQAPTPLLTLVPDAPVDLIAIVDKAMARDPAARFPTAREMVLELKRFQQGQLVKSHAYTPWQLLRRWVTRNRAAVVVGAIATVALVGFGGFLLYRLVEEQQATQAESVAAREQTDAVTLREAQAALAIDPTEAVAILKRLSPGTAEARTARMVASEAAAAGIAHVLKGEGRVVSLAFSPDGRTLTSYEAGSRKLRRWDLATWTGQVIGQAPEELLEITSTADALRGFDRRGQIWEWSVGSNQSSPRLVRTIAGDRWTWVRWSPDGTRLALELVSEVGESTVRLVDLGSEDRPIGSLLRPEWTTDGRSILGFDKPASTVRRYEVATGTLTEVFGKAWKPIFGGDGTRTWIARDTSRFREHDQEHVRELRSGHRIFLAAEAVRLAPLPDGGVVVTTSQDRQLNSAETLRSAGSDFAIDPGITTKGDHAVLVSDGFPGHVTRLRGHMAAVRALAVSTAGTIATGDERGEIRVWTLPVVAREHVTASTTFAALARGNQLVSTRLGPRLEVRDLARGTSRMLSLPAPPTEEGSYRMTRSRFGELAILESTEHGTGEIVEMKLSADGVRAVTLDTTTRATVWDLVTGKVTPIADRVIHIAINADGSKVATTRDDGGSHRLLEEWNVARGTPSRLAKTRAQVMGYGSGDRLVVATDTPGLFVFEEGRTPVRIEVEPGDAFRALACSRDGRRLYLGSDSWDIRIYDFDTDTWQSLHGHMGSVIALALSEDGKRLFSAAADNTIRVWNLVDGTSAVLRGHEGMVTSIEVGMNDMLLTSSLDGTARIWDLTTRYSRPLIGHTHRVLFATQLPGGRLITVDRAHQIAEYADSLPFDPFLLHAWLASATNLTK